MPGPLSSTASTPSADPDRNGAAGRAPLRGVVEQVGDRALERAGLADHPPGRDVDVELDARGAPSNPDQRAVDHLGQVDRLHDVGERLVAGQLDQVADQRGQLLDLRADVVEQLGAGLGRQAARSGLVGLDSRSRLVRSDVSGVRSSCPASATSCRCRSRDAARAVSIGLNAVARRAISSSPSTGSGVRSSVRAIPSTAVVSRRTGRRPLRATAPPGHAGRDHAGDAEEQHHPAELGEHLLLRLERLGDAQRLPGRRGGDGDHAVAGAAGGDGADARLLVTGRDRRPPTRRAAASARCRACRSCSW